MALPKLNDTPKYELKIPSTGKKVKFRPYLVKEEKVLLMAAETGDINQVMNSIIDTVCACTNDKVDRTQLTTFDLEYMFVKIRSKSVGENVELNLKCESCEHPNNHTVNLDEVECVNKRSDYVVQLTDKIAVELKYPSYGSIDLTGDDSTLGFEVLANCISAVLTEDERIDIADEPKESVHEFLESMSKDQFDKLSDVLNDMPQVKMDVSFDCEKCEHHNELQIKGIQSFF